MPARNEQTPPADEGPVERPLGLPPRAPLVPMPQPDIVLRIELAMVAGGFIKPAPLYTADSMRRYAADLDEQWRRELDAAVAAERERWERAVAQVRDEFAARYAADTTPGYKKWDAARLAVDALLRPNAGNEGPAR